MASIPLGAKGIFTLAVAPQRLANQFKDATLPPELATPVRIMAMENAALNALKPYLEPGESALGTAVGQRIMAEAEVTGVEGRPIEFKVWAYLDQVRLSHIPEVAPAAKDGRSRFQSGLQQAAAERAYEFTP